MTFIYRSTASNLFLISLYLSILLTKANLIIFEFLAPPHDFRVSGDIPKAFKGDTRDGGFSGELYRPSSGLLYLSLPSSSPEVVLLSWERAWTPTLDEGSTTMWAPCKATLIWSKSLSRLKHLVSTASIMLRLCTISFYLSSCAKLAFKDSTCMSIEDLTCFSNDENRSERSSWPWLKRSYNTYLSVMSLFSI